MKKCNLTLAMSPTFHSNNTLLICWHEFFLGCSQYQVKTDGRVGGLSVGRTGGRTAERTDRQRCICTGGLKDYKKNYMSGCLNGRYTALIRDMVDRNYILLWIVIIILRHVENSCRNASHSDWRDDIFVSPQLSQADRKITADFIYTFSCIKGA